MGFSRGERKGAYDCRTRADLTAKRDMYLSKIVMNRKAPIGLRRRIVYMDESYVHEHYSSNNQMISLYHPDDSDLYMKKKRYKGRRYYFIAAILGPDLNVSEELCDESQRAQLMPATLDIFRGGKKLTPAEKQKSRSIFTGLGIYKDGSKAGKKDYHSMFDHDYFSKWMDVLLDDLEKRGIQNAIITMDNAKYHKKFPDHVPTSSRRQVWYEYARTHNPNIPAYNNVTVAMLQEMVKNVNELLLIERKAKEREHDVIFTPPYHSDLQPIELIWAIVKGEVGRQHEHGASFQETLQRLVNAFNNLTSHQVQGCISKAMSFETKFWEAATTGEQVECEDDYDEEMLTDEEEQ